MRTVNNDIQEYVSQSPWTTPLQEGQNQEPPSSLPWASQGGKLCFPNMLVYPKMILTLQTSKSQMKNVPL